MLQFLPDTEEKLAQSFIEKFEKAKIIRQNFEDVFDEC